MKRRLITIISHSLMLLLTAQSCTSPTATTSVKPIATDRHPLEAPSSVMQPTATTPTTRPGHGTATAEWVTLSVTMPPSSRMGSALPADVVLRNGSGLTVEYKDTEPSEYVFAMRTIDAEGRRVREFSPPLSAGPGRLKAGETLTQQIDLAKRLRLQGPGEYLLTVSFWFRAEGRLIMLHVNHVPFRVEPDP